MSNRLRPRPPRPSQRRRRTFFESLEPRQVLASDYSVAVDLPQLNDGNSGATQLTFTITRTDVSADGTVDFSLGGSATSGVDFNNVQIAGAVEAPAGTLTFATGDSTATIKLDVLGDTAPEPNETIEVLLANP